MIDVLITSCGRQRYLDKLFSSLHHKCKAIHSELRIILVDNSANIDTSVQQWVGGYCHSFEIIRETERISIDDVVAKYIARQDKAEYFWKLDEDALLCSDDFGQHLKQIMKLFPRGVFSPFPVGLINNLGGPSATVGRMAVLGEETDTYYTVRPVNHVGGFCRIMPSEALDGLSLNSGHTEDTIISAHARRKGHPLFYLENTLIVEHQESTLGQHARYGKEYFGARF